MAAAAKTKATLYTHAETAINTLVNGAAYELPSGTVAVSVDVYFSPVTVTASTTGTYLRLQGSPSTAAEVAGDAGTDHWVDLAVFVTANAYTGLTDRINDAGNCAAGDLTIPTDAAAVFGARTALVFIQDSTTAGEWVLATNHASNVLNIASPGTRVAHLDNMYLFGFAEKFKVDLDTTGIKRLRLVVDNNSQATGPTVAVTAEIVSYQPETA